MNIAHRPSDVQAVRADVPAGLIKQVLDGSGGQDELRSLLAQQVAEHDYVLLSLADHCADYEAFRTGCTAIAQSLGEMMVQNEAGDTVIEVYDRNVGRIEEGARYHQTRQGGDIHTDSVNRPEPMLYLILACASPALLGGESILIRAGDVFEELKAYPDVVEILSQPFYFEGRGMQAEPMLFRIPVLTQTETGPSFRYLRSYIASAHERAGEPLTTDQVYAFDVLDALVELSALQQRVTLQQGDVLIADDTRVFHGRTSFIDGVRPGAWTQGRCMLRYWIE